jgi:hypothetical protein
VSILRAKTVIVGVVLAACGGGQLPAEVVTTTAPPASTATSGGVVASTLPSCSEFPQIFAPDEAYGDSPMYFANEMPTEQVRAWASTQPGFEAIWLDREHNGWITVAFSEDAATRQAELATEFPDVGVVAVQVDWTLTELDNLQQRVTDFLSGLVDSSAVGRSENRGVVDITVGIIDDDVRAEIEQEFGGERVCLDAADPSTLPAPGPQAAAGDGWRLLVDRIDVGDIYRTAIAFDDESLNELWETIGLDDPLPLVNFNDEVVIWFGAVFGSSCPNLRLDDVVVDGGLVHALIVMPDPPVVCTDDANRRAFVVAVERSKLPVGPFRIQLSADNPPAGFPEERTLVDADLSQPGAVAGPDQVHPDPSPLTPFAVTTGDIIEPGYPTLYEMNVRCGIEWLGELNFYRWRTDETMPPAWEDLVEDGKLRVDVVLIIEDDPVVQASAGGATLTYRPTNELVPEC